MQCDNGLLRAAFNLGRLVPVGLAYVVRPTIGGGEEQRSNHALGVA
jgi:hypothetical protein